MKVIFFIVVINNLFFIYLILVKVFSIIIEEYFLFVDLN